MNPISLLSANVTTIMLFAYVTVDEMMNKREPISCKYAAGGSIIGTFDGRRMINMVVLTSKEYMTNLGGMFNSSIRRIIFDRLLLLTC